LTDRDDNDDPHLPAGVSAHAQAGGGGQNRAIEAEGQTHEFRARAANPSLLGCRKGRTNADRLKPGPVIPVEERGDLAK
jgi:hypothetical protein